MSDYQIGENPVEKESAAGKGMGERFAGGSQERRDEASEEFADSARRALDKETKD